MSDLKAIDAGLLKIDRSFIVGIGQAELRRKSFELPLR